MTKQTFPGSFPAEMRRQLWPLCCGATLLSGFKDAHGKTHDQLVADIKTHLAAVPDFQVFAGEQMNPQLCFVVLNASQSASPKITDALTEVGFIKFGSAGLWSGTGTFWVYATKDFKIEDSFTSYAAAKATQTKLVGKGAKAKAATGDGDVVGPASPSGTKGAAAA